MAAWYSWACRCNSGNCCCFRRIGTVFTLFHYCTEEDEYTYAWIAFDDLLNEGHDPAEVIAIIAENSNPFIAELVAAANCGEATCYADYFDDFAEGAAPVLDDFEANEMEVTKDRQAGASFANNPGRPKKGWKEKLKCKIRGGANC